MTDRAKRLRPPAASVTMAVAAGTFLSAFAFLADQLRTGNDPAIGLRRAAPRLAAAPPSSPAPAPVVRTAAAALAAPAPVVTRAS